MWVGQGGDVGKGGTVVRGRGGNMVRCTDVSRGGDVGRIGVAIRVWAAIWVRFVL